MIRFPAEWEPQSAIIIAWPHSTGDFINLSDVEDSYHFIALTISRMQPLIILCKDSAHQQHIQSRLNRSEGVHFILAEYNDIWVRDTVFLTMEWDHPKAKVQLLNFRFNGWGGKYPCTEDNNLNFTLFDHPLFKGYPTATIDLVLEGGSIETDGRGVLLSTKNCLFNPNRNPHLSSQAIQNQLQHYLGAKRILWIEQDHLAGDDTDAHIDTLARFIDERTIAYTSSDNMEDPHFHGLKHMENQLQALRTASGEPYRLIPLPLPQAILDEQGQRLPANYVNFLFINGGVLVPVYDDKMDHMALERLADALPEHEIIPTPCRPLVHQFGSLHCATMQIPACMKLAF
jgi:agmatine/peptidylarginine deiminase